VAPDAEEVAAQTAAGRDHRRAAVTDRRLREVLHEKRPHQARDCPPMHAWRSLDKATPEIDGQPLLAKTRVRRDHVDHWGSVTLRYRRKLHHISVGRAQRHKRVLILMADLDVRVVDEDGVLLRHFELDPTRDYQARGRSSL